MTSVPYGEQHTDHTHSLCLYRLREIFKTLLFELVVYYARSHDLTNLDSWKAVKGVLHAAMGTVEFNLEAQGFKSRDPLGLSVPRPKMMVGAGGIMLCDEEGNGVFVQKHVGVMTMRAILEDDISVVNMGFTRGHNMTREEGWTVVRALLKEAEEIITEGMEKEVAKLKRQLRETKAT